MYTALDCILVFVSCGPGWGRRPAGRQTARRANAARTVGAIIRVAAELKRVPRLATASRMKSATFIHPSDRLDTMNQAATTTTVLDNLNTSAVVNLMPTDQVLSNETYQNMAPPKSFLGIQTSISAENWKTFAINEAEKIRSVAQELGVEVVSLIFCKMGLK